jgi:PEP-CTERM motif-containing protein
MRWKQCLVVAMVFLLNGNGLVGQGILVVDQASGDLTEPIVNSQTIPLNDLAQSFTPSMSAVGFVQLRSLVTGNPPGRSVTLIVNLHEGAFNGPIISSTDPVVIAGFAGLGTFYFPDNIPVTPGQLYFFRPVLQSLGSVEIGYKDNSTYDRGEPWFSGLPSGPGDFWFREGIVVPEPGVLALLMVGSGAFLWFRRRPVS